MCASCLKSLQTLSKIKSHIVKGRTGVPCEMGAELGAPACRKSSGPSGAAPPVVGCPSLQLTLQLFWHPEPLTATEAATRAADDPSGFVGKKVSVNFGEGEGTHLGTVESFDRETGYNVTFPDGDAQDYGILELSRMLSP